MPMEKNTIDKNYQFIEKKKRIRLTSDFSTATPGAQLSNNFKMLKENNFEPNFHVQVK